MLRTSLNAFANSSTNASSNSLETSSAGTARPAPSVTPQQPAAYALESVAHLSEAAACRYILGKIDAAKRLPSQDLRVAAWDYFNAALQDPGLQLGSAARGTLKQFLVSPTSVENRLQAFEAQMMAARTNADADACVSTLGRLRETLQAPWLQPRLDRIEKYLLEDITTHCALANLRGAHVTITPPGAPNSANSTNSASSNDSGRFDDADSWESSGPGAGAPWAGAGLDMRALVMRQIAEQQQIAGLLQDPDLAIQMATKVKVTELAEAGALSQPMSPATSRASYLASSEQPRLAYRISNTVDNGGFTKIRNYVDADGHTGKMRVIHLNDQRRERPKVGVEKTRSQDVRSENRALKKANSPLQYKHIFAVTTPGMPAATKLYLPVPDLGLDTYHFRHNAETGPRARYAAAALRMYLSQANEPLVALHRKEGDANEAWIHRDIKPQNILVDPAGIVNLIDFGLAQPVSYVQGAGLAGTPGFVAPEYYTQEVENPESMGINWPIGPKMDVWSLASAAANTFFKDAFRALPTQQPGVADDMDATHANMQAALLQEKWQRAQLGGSDPTTLAKQLKFFRAKDSNSAYEAARFDKASHALNNLQAQIQATDPELSKIFMQRLLRVDPSERYSSEQLAQELTKLEPLFGSPLEDLSAGAEYFAHLWPKAEESRAHYASHKTSNQDQAGRLLESPTVSQLAGLPAFAPSHGSQA